MSRRLLKGLEESVEDLIYDEHLVFAYLRRHPCLLHEFLDVLHRVVASRIKFENIIGPLFIEGLATLTLITGFTVLGGVLTVDGDRIAGRVLVTFSRRD
jgi:hypothetical protein